MKNDEPIPSYASHNHVFLGQGHERNERKTWGVICLCSFMMLAEIIGGKLFGSLALVADGLHMSTHAAALLIAALAYTYSRRHATDARFVFGTGKLGDLAGFTSAIVLAMIALLIGYEAVIRLLAPVLINFKEAIPIAIIGLLVNIASAWMLSDDDHHHGHHHHHAHGHEHEHEHGEEIQRLQTAQGIVDVEIFEDGAPPRFRLRFDDPLPMEQRNVVMIETDRPNGQHQIFRFVDRGDFMESIDEIPEPHEFCARLRMATGDYQMRFIEHAHAHHQTDQHNSTHRDNNMRAAYAHVLADAAVSVLAIVGLSLGSYFGWVWMDPVAGIVGALVIANWSHRLLRETGGILLDMRPDQHIEGRVRRAIETDGDQLTDLHLWRLGPGHIGAIIAVSTQKQRDSSFYRIRLNQIGSLSHVTIEVQPFTSSVN